MRPQCKRIYSALPTQCERICEGRCNEPCAEVCVGDASPESIVQRTENRKGGGLSKAVASPSPSPLEREVFQELRSGLDSLMLNDQGRPWPYPNRALIARVVSEHDADHVRRGAREAREIIQSQDRAPNVSKLFEKKVCDLAAEAKIRAGVRAEIHESIAEAA